MSYSEKLKDPRWQKKRLEILQRDNWMCQHCGSTEKTLHVHHKAYSKVIWEINNELLITLCHECHQEEESRLKHYSITVIDDLRQKGFMSMGMASLPEVFTTDRGWSDYDPAFDILKMAVDDTEIWFKLQEEYFKRLGNKSQNKNG